MTQEEIQQWHQDEIKWWNKFSSIMAKQWELDEHSNNILRKSNEEDSYQYLLKENGYLLDLGCGSGWLSFKYEKNGMKTLGIDFSSEQIKLADQKKIEQNAINASFMCCDILNWDYSDYIHSFDSIHVSAFLHHLPESELAALFEIISKVSKDEAKIYLYEPVYSTQKNLNIFKKAFLYFINKSVSFFVFHIPSLLNFWDDDYKNAQKQGYTGTSPHESALNYSFLQTTLKNYSLELESISPVHYRSLVYGILTNSMKPQYQSFFKKFLKYILKLDHFLFKWLGWENIGGKRDFLLCSIKIKKSTRI